MSAAAYMLSLLGRQHQLLGAEFFQRYSSDWLVWEPGPWRPARSILTSNSESTLLPSNPETRRPVGEDALCFELKRVASAALTVGRGSENHIVINDLTVSREQFVLRFSDKSWLVQGRETPLMVDGKPVAKEGTVLQDGFVIATGDVRMSFYTPEGFPRRLELESKKPS